MKKIILHTCILGIISFFAACDTYDNGILNDVNQSNPTTITLDATNITESSAVVSGKINKEYWDYVVGNNSYCGVFYSTYKGDLLIDNYEVHSYTNETKANDIAEEFSVTLWGLEETETYYYRAFVCVNDVLYRLGEIKSFTTLETPEPEKPEIKMGVFSVGSGNYINFSPGNLQYHARNKSWRFAPEQYEYIGDGNRNIDISSYNGRIDLFGWGTGNAPTRYSTNESSYKTFIDWGGNMIWDDNLLYEAGTWRTLTTDEWEYLVSKRSNASSLIGVAQVAGTNGLILLPDDWECPDGITFNSGFGSSYSSVNTYNASKWAILESAGAIFLPAGGYRSNATLYDVQQYGNYWTATYEGFSKDGAYYNYYMDFSMSECSVRQRGLKLYCGASVRLVKSL